MRTEITIPTDDGDCPATLHTPAGGGSHPAVVLYPDAGGVRDTFAAMADRLAGLGYAVLLPDVYYRAEWAPFDIATVFDDPAERARLAALSTSVDAAMAARDAGAFLAFLLAGRPEVSGEAVGTTGYCMGGRMSLLAAAHHPDRVAAAASFHGGGLAGDDPDSPHLLAGRIRGEVLVAAAEGDRVFPPEQHERLRQAFDAAGVRYRLETYPAAHGFAVPDNPTYDAAADERHWDALAGLYGRALHG